MSKRPRRTLRAHELDILPAPPPAEPWRGATSYRGPTGDVATATIAAAALQRLREEYANEPAAQRPDGTHGA